MSVRIPWPWVLILLGAFIAGCGEPDSTGIAGAPPVPIEPGDECHVCGMIISNFPGPKGQAYVRGTETALKYCSTRDLFSELLQPEMKSAARKIYVHDMGATDWQRPADAAFIDGRTAWYVAGHELRGAMGPTLAAFAQRTDAERFAAEHGGRLVRFNEITLELLATLENGTGAHGNGHPVE